MILSKYEFMVHTQNEGFTSKKNSNMEEMRVRRAQSEEQFVEKRRVDDVVIRTKICFESDRTLKIALPETYLYCF